MMSWKLGAWVFASAAVAAACSGGRGPAAGTETSAISFRLVTNGVEITSLSYDVNTQGGEDVLEGTIPVPNPSSEISGTVDALAPGAYSLVLAGVGRYDGQTLPCVSEPARFSLVGNQVLELPPISLRCSIPAADDAGRVTFSADVELEQINVENFVEAFAIAPRTVRGQPLSEGACWYPPIALVIANQNPAIAYVWSATPDGTFRGSSVNGVYHCASSGEKTLTLTATLDSVTVTKNATVSCEGSVDGPVCAGPGGECGDDIVQAPEQCDEVSPRCVACRVVPVCGDGVVDPPEECEPLRDEDCSGFCEWEDPLAACMSCLDRNPDIGPLQRELCHPDPLCTDVQNCVFESDCFAPVAAVCYCGSDVLECEKPEFVPNGPCVSEIRAAAGMPGLTNAEVLERYFAFEWPLGLAMSIIDEATRVCTDPCFDDHVPPFCGNGVLNPGEECEPPGTSVCSAICTHISHCGDGVIQPDEQCEPPGVGACGGTCRRRSVCGNGLIESGEQCDPPVSGLCSSECSTLPVCGNGVLEFSEECEPPGSARCDASCRRRALCGDGLLELDEACEPPNTPGCDASCRRIAFCGDGSLDVGEECEPAGANGCDASCQKTAVCGNGVIEPTESCDPPNGDDCSARCQAPSFGSECRSCIDASPDLASVQSEFCDTSPACLAVEVCVLETGCFLPSPAVCYCGPDVAACAHPAFVPVGPCVDQIRAASGIVSPVNSEVLDRYFAFEQPLGIAMSIIDELTRVCPTQCPRGSGCGNGVIDFQEQCEPPNAGCGVDCRRVPSCGNRLLEQGETCEPSNTATCSQTCNRVADCGDGTVELNEQCEPPGTASCDAACRTLVTPGCGNGRIDLGETCEPPNGSTCSTSCQYVPVCGNGVLEPGEACEPPNTATCGGACQRP